MSIIWTILVGLVAGWLAGLIMRGRGFGFFGDVIVGIVGALLGGLVFGMLGVGATSVLGQILVATIGAVILLFLVGLIPRNSKIA